MEGYDAILSLGCGAGVALLADTKDIPVYPALDTMFIGAAQGLANWQAECSACGSCVLGETGWHLPGHALREGHHERPVRRREGRPVRAGRPGLRVGADPRAARRQDPGKGTCEIGAPKDNSAKHRLPATWDMNDKSGRRE